MVGNFFMILCSLKIGRTEIKKKFPQGRVMLGQLFSSFVQVVVFVSGTAGLEGKHDQKQNPLYKSLPNEPAS